MNIIRLKNSSQSSKVFYMLQFDGDVQESGIRSKSAGYYRKALELLLKSQNREMRTISERMTH